MPQAVFIVRDSTGAITFDNRVALAGAPALAPLVPASTAVSYPFPNHVGRQAIVGNPFGRRVAGVTVDYSLGYPVVNAASSLGARQLIIWIR